MKFVQHVCERGNILQQMRYVAVVLIPKTNSGDFRGIGLLDPIWMVLEKMERRLANLECYHYLHRFTGNRGMGTTVLGAKRMHHLAFPEQMTTYGGFVGPKKEFDDMDRDTCIEILRNRSVEEKTLWLIFIFW